MTFGGILGERTIRKGSESQLYLDAHVFWVKVKTGTVEKLSKTADRKSVV